MKVHTGRSHMTTSTIYQALTVTTL